MEIKIHNGSLLDARALHMLLCSNRNFADWIKERIKQSDSIENEHYFTFQKNVKNFETTECYITLEVAKKVAYLELDERKKEIEAYFNEVEKALQIFKHSDIFQDFLALTAFKQGFLEVLNRSKSIEADYIQIDMQEERTYAMVKRHKFSGNDYHKYEG